MNSQHTTTEPDSDSIKMFVGQIPRHMTESDLQTMFEEFGPVYQLNILRDKATGHSKGCCFVTFYTRRSALEAQNALHNIKTLPGMQHPVQMKPADSEKRVEDRKLFVGMLSKKLTENDVHLMFSPFGMIEECTVLREQTGHSKGCAFVTFGTRNSAQNAIRNLHHSRTLEGCRSPLVVKLADSQKEKEMKRLQQMQSQLMNGASVETLSQHYLNLLQQSAGSGNGGALGNLGLGLNALLNAASGSGAMGGSLQNSQNDGGSGLQSYSTLHNLALAALANVGMQMGNSNNGSNSGLNSMACLQNSLPHSGGAIGNGSLNGGGGLSGLGGDMMRGGGLNGGGQNYSALQQQYGGLSSLFNPGSFSGSGLSAQLQQQTLTAGGMGGGMSGWGGVNNFMGMANTLNSPAGKETEGPEGSNLFIYHLPQEYTDHDLLQMFLQFGTVISSKIFIDKQTNLSKCFGFVSFDNSVSAQNAIQSMNGYQIGTKRLKVQLKKPKSESRLY